MGLIEPDASSRRAALRSGRGSPAGHARRQAGIASGAAAALNNVETPSGEELAALLRTMIAALEASPVPKFEWSRAGASARHGTARRRCWPCRSRASTAISPGSATRRTPIAARLHFLALVIGDLAGSYNDVGIRRWFGRKRTALGGRAPAQLLTGDWDPEDAGPARVRELARELVTMSVT